MLCCERFYHQPIGSHELFNRLVSKKTLTGEDEDETSELKYLQVIKDIRDNDPELFERIKRLPKKARSAKIHTTEKDHLITFFRRGKLQKFFISGKKEETRELDFLSAAEFLESGISDKREKLAKPFYKNDLKCVGIIDEWQNLNISLSFDKPASVYGIPVHTISQSETQYEKVYQSSALIPCWKINLSAHHKWTIELIQGFSDFR